MNHFKSLGVWHSGHSGIRKGDVIFFDFNGNGTPDHIGLVRFADNDGVHTTEGNTSNAVKERVRTTGILGYGRPKYKGGSVPTPPPSGSTWLDKVMASLPDVKNGDSGANVETVQGLCNARMTTGQTLLKIDGDFGSKTETAVKSVQAHYKLTTDGVVGEHTWTVLITAKG
jgi:murein L,D-transpeptidase YcbB/YkuD